MITCKTCGEELSYSGRGRRPVYCKPHAKAANVKRTIDRKKRKAAHARGETLGKWGEYWLVDGKPIKRVVSDGSADRKDRHDYSMYDDPRRGDGAEDIVIPTTAAVFNPLGAQGAPVGTSTNYKDLATELDAKTREARETGKPWLMENGTWWKFEEFANTATTIDVREAIGVHGRGAEYKPHTQEELDEWADYIDGLDVHEYAKLQMRIINRKRTNNGLAPIKEDKMNTYRESSDLTFAMRMNDNTYSSEAYRDGRSPVGPMANVYSNQEWTTEQMAHLVRLRTNGKKFTEIARDFAYQVGQRSADSLSRKYNRLVKQGRNRALYLAGMSTNPKES